MPYDPTAISDTDPLDRWKVRLIKVFSIVLCIYMLTNLFLGLFDKAVRLSERRVSTGEHYIVRRYGDLGKSGQASIVCRYWNGSRVRTTVYWYAPNDMFGRSSCPLVVKTSAEWRNARD